MSQQGQNTVGYFTTFFYNVSKLSRYHWATSSFLCWKSDSWTSPVLYGFGDQELRSRTSSFRMTEIDPLLPDRSSAPTRARLRYKCRSIDLMHHWPDMVKRKESKEIVIISESGDILGIKKIELFGLKSCDWRYRRKIAGSRTRASYSQVASFWSWSTGMLKNG